MTRIFRDRQHAGEVLAAELVRRGLGPGGKRRTSLMVLALPRGGVPVGVVVARKLNVPLDVFVVRKLGVPSHPELAMGAIGPGGETVWNEPVIRKLRISAETLKEVTITEMRELRRRESHYRGDLPPLEPEDASVLLVDDGLATGATMKAAVGALRARKAERISVAVPVAPLPTCTELASVADEVVCPVQAEDFVAVGQWYEDFSQTTDEEVRRLLSKARAAGDRLVS